MKLKNKSTFLSIIGAFGVVATAVMAAKETPKALKLLEEEEDIKGEQLTVSEKIFVTAPAYWKTAALGVGTVICIFGANALNRRQQASLVSACTMATNSFNNYRNEVRERIGEEEERDIYTKIKKQEIADIPKHNPTYMLGENVYLFTNGQEEDQRLFYDDCPLDPDKKRFFECSLSHVIESIYHFNRNYSLMGTQTVNDLADFIGLPRVENDDIGWWCGGNAEGFSCIDFELIEMQVGEDNLECIMISPVLSPEPIEDMMKTSGY